MRSKQAILDYFKFIVRRELLGSSYLFIGEDYSPVREVACLIACAEKESFCGECWDCRHITSGSHPDVLIIKPDGLTTKIAMIREGMRFLSLKSYRLPRKILIVEDAQTLSEDAANAFLKTLEEPPENSFIAVCSSQLEDMLATIISRCRKVFLPAGSGDFQIGNMAAVEKFFQGEPIKFKDRRDFAAFLLGCLKLTHERLKIAVGGENNELIDFGKCEIILNSCRPKQLQALLDTALRVYADHKTINMNLALNLLRENL